MDHWPWYIGLLWWFSWGSGPLSPLFQNSLYWCYDQWCYNGKIWGMGPFDVLWTSLQRFWRIPLYIPHHTPPCHICTYRWLHFFHKRIFVLRSHQEAFDSISSFEVYLYSIFLASSFEAFTQPFVIWHHYVVLFLVASHAALVFFCLFLWAGVLIFIFTLLIAQSGYLHLVRTFFRFCSSCYNNSGLEHMVFAL